MTVFKLKPKNRIFKPELVRMYNELVESFNETAAREQQAREMITTRDRKVVAQQGAVEYAAEQLRVAFKDNEMLHEQVARLQKQKLRQDEAYSKRVRVLSVLLAVTCVVAMSLVIIVMGG